MTQARGTRRVIPEENRNTAMIILRLEAFWSGSKMSVLPAFCTVRFAGNGASLIHFTLLRSAPGMGISFGFEVCRKTIGKPFTKISIS